MLTIEGGSGCARVGGRVGGLTDNVPWSRLDAVGHGVALNRSMVKNGARYVRSLFQYERENRYSRPSVRQSRGGLFFPTSWRIATSV